MTEAQWYTGYAKLEGTSTESAYRYLTIDQTSTEQALEHLAHATLLRMEKKPEKWARDVERKALRRFEHSFELRHMFDRSVALRPSCLLPGSYSQAR